MDPTLNTTRVVDIYSKGGDVGVYSTILALIPDHDIGFTILAAGAAPNAQIQPLKTAITDLFVRSIINRG